MKQGDVSKELNKVKSIVGEVKNELENLFELVDSKVEAFFELDGMSMELAQFSINFKQEHDHKGQPQSDTKGGQFSLTFTQIVPDSIYDWAKRSNKTKDGAIVFKSETKGTVLKVQFQNAHCINISRVISSKVGTKTTLVIAPEIVKMNEYTHKNRWRS